MSALVDGVYAMNVGEKIAEGTVAEVTANETVRKVLSRRGDRDGSASRVRFRRCADPFLEIESLSVLYDKAQALEAVSLHVPHGEFVAIVGLNGAGKTPLFNAVSGLVPYGGEIRRQGRSLADKRPRALMMRPDLLMLDEPTLA